MKAQKRIAAEILKCSRKRVVFDSSKLDEIKEAITKEDIRKLINSNSITKAQKKGVSRTRAKKRAEQKRKGRKHGQGTRKGKRTARLKRKDAWKNRIRLQRKFLKELKEKGKISKKEYRSVYKKAKGGFFRSRRHLKLLIGEQK